MATRMLIDARHPEETRVAVLKGNRIEEFDFESADRKQIKGNIYLAKVTRVEPSLQAAFVDFGGNRHGFLAFSEIHPDYYQIPKEDREALLAEEAAHAEEEAALRAADEVDDPDQDDDNGDDNGGLTEVDTSEFDQVSTIEAGHVENGGDDAGHYDYAEGDEFAAGDYDGDGDAADEHRVAADDDDLESAEGDELDDARPRRRGRRRQGRRRSKEADDLRARRMALRRRYKIQDVIHRRQVLLVQVVKEERGNKGAALTSYLSLAGRYCVLMPNSSHGGGISRKISSTSDRKRLKAVIAELGLPKTMGCIVRTAGLSRTKTEIKRDFDYLARLWDELRETTLKSSAPALIHSDSDLIKRAIRDIYNRDIEEVVVEGEEGYKAAKAFMKLLMPSHARRVKSYDDPVPLFQRYGAEDQLMAMYDPVVQLRSGGYIVINPTEALVSIDINSGRSTKEYGIEATALNTNLEAAHEIARQLRLRDMAGLVVIDFIDMEHGSSIRKVERAMKDALKHDRARIQIGRISSFGLMEMSRQRLRTGVLEATTRDCPHCDGTGLVRTASSAGLSALRLIEDEAAKGKGSVISLFASTEAAIYLLNAKRSDLADIEARYGVQVEVIPEGENEGAKMRVASSGPRVENLPVFRPIVEEFDDDDEEVEFDDSDVAAAGEEEEEFESGSRRKRRRRGRGRDREREQHAGQQAEDDAEDEEESPVSGDVSAEEDGEAPKKRRRRGGRRRRGRNRGAPGESPAEGETVADRSDAESEEFAETGYEAHAPEGVEPETLAEEAVASQEAVADDPEPSETGEFREAAPRKRSRGKRAEASRDAAPEEAEAGEEVVPAKARRSRRRTEPDVEVQAEGDARVDQDEDSASKPKRGHRKKDAPVAPGADDAPASPSRSRRRNADPAPQQPVEAEVDAVLASGNAVETEPAPFAEPGPHSVEASAHGDDQPDGEPRRGWWQRTFGE